MKNLIRNTRNVLLLKKITFILLFTCFVSVIGNLTILFVEATPFRRVILVSFVVCLLCLYIVLRKILFDLPRHFFKESRVSPSAQLALNNAVGPAPWYWKTFPSIQGSQKNKYGWNYHGSRGKHAYLVSLSCPGDSENIKLVVNTYTRAFFVPPHYVGLWFMDKTNIKILCFDPDKMPSFILEELPEDFRRSKEAFYSLGTPVCSVGIPRSLQEGEHELRFPVPLQLLEEIFLVIPYAQGQAAYANFAIYPQNGKVMVMPQKWFTKESFDLGYEWITRITRDPQTGILYGDGVRIGIFELTPDGCQIARWVGVS